MRPWLVQGLDLYGRADHLQKTPAPLTAAGRLQMATRALYLLLVFLPFLLLGPLLLYLGYLTAKPSHTSGMFHWPAAPGRRNRLHRAAYVHASTICAVTYHGCSSGLHPFSNALCSCASHHQPV